MECDTANEIGANDRSRATLAELIHAARHGDREALATLIDNYRDELLRLARCSISPAVQAKVAPSDLLQETFLAAEQGLAGFRGETWCELRAWLRRILARNASEAHRIYARTAKRQVTKEVSLSAGDAQGGLRADDPSPSRRLMADDEQESLDQAIRSLAPDFRRIILWHHREGLSFSEIATRMNQPTSVVRRLWIRALAELRKRLGHEHISRR
jgi:RNA polymerase sigma-70 factor, ECF subfamily